MKSKLRLAVLCTFGGALAGLVIALPGIGTAAEFDPFFPGSDLQGYSEIALFWNKVPGASPSTTGKMYDLEDGLPPDSSVLLAFPRQNPIPLPPVSGERNIIVASATLNGDKISDPIVAWNGPGDSVSFMIPHLGDNTLTWSDATVWSVPGGGTRVLVNTGNFDEDRQDEFVVTYAGADSLIHMDIYDTDSSFTPRLVRSIAQDSVHTMPKFYRDFPDPDNPPSPPGNCGTYALIVGDFNADHKSELLLLSARPGANNRWEVHASLYRDPLVDDTPTIQRVVYSAIPSNYLNDTARVAEFELVAQGGNLDQYYGDEGVVAIHLTEVRSPNPNRYYDSTFVGILQVTESPDDISVSDYVAHDWGSQDGDISLAIGDLNGDGPSEFVVLYKTTLQIFQSDNLTPVQKLQQNTITYPTRFFTSYQAVAIGDMDADLRSEVVVVDNEFDPSADAPSQDFRIQVYNTTAAVDSLMLKCRINQDETQSSNSNYNSGRRFAVVMGDFNGDRLRLGPPTYSIDRDVSQPLVILNSPPIHFDILHGDTYDVSGCYNGQTCGFSSTYEKSTSTTVQVTSEVSVDWSMDATLTKEVHAGTDTPIGKVAASLEQNTTLKYGGKFSRVRNSSKTVNIAVKVQATSGDQIYGIVSDYEVWEYPVFDDTGQVGHIVVVKPTVKESRWFPASSWTGFSYVPNHQVGNVLSYSDYNGLSSIDYLDEPIKVNVGDGFTLGPTTSFEWSLGYEDFSSESASTSHSFGIGLGIKASAEIDAGFKYAGAELSVGGKVTGEYKTETNANLVSTLATTVRQTLSLKAVLGSVTSGDDKAYEVTPYAYWGKSGALVLDFAARPQAAPAGYPITWWQQEYATRTDPGFLLPFLYDQQKGLILVDPEKRFLTKEILLEPSHPQIGDTVTITARIHNLSLIPINQFVDLRFYMGNPTSGGVLITPVGGSPDVYTDSTSIAARGQAIVQVRWVVPPDVTSHAHIYAAIDPAGFINEIHEDNNIAFAVLGNEDGVVPTGVDDQPGSDLLADTYELSQNYPNPFNPSTTIEYAVPVKSQVRLTILNILGQEVNTILDAEESPGVHKAVWDGNNLDGTPVASGVYFYKLIAGDFSESKKMLLLK